MAKFIRSDGGGAKEDPTRQLWIPDLTQRREDAEAQRKRLKSEVLCGAIPENCAFLAKFPERSSPMTNDKFSMTNFQFRLGVLVAACRAAPLRLCVGFFSPIAWKMAGGVMESRGEGWLNLAASPLLQHPATPLGLLGKGGEIEVN